MSLGKVLINNRIGKAVKFLKKRVVYSATQFVARVEMMDPTWEKVSFMVPILS